MSFFSWLRNLKSVLDLSPARRTRLRTPRRGPAAGHRPALESLEDRCTPSAAFLGGYAQVELVTAENSYALVLPNGTIHAVPPAPVFGLLTAATPPQPITPPEPVIPTSFQGFLGHSALELNVNVDGASLTLPNGTIRAVPPSPIFGLLTAATPPSPVVPPSPVIPTSFQGFLGRSELELNINVDGATVALPGDTVLVPPNPCLPGLLTAARWAG